MRCCVYVKGENKQLYWDKFLVENKKGNFLVVLKLGWMVAIW